MILWWDKPERVMSVEDWKKLGFDGGPPGAYVPNMSTEDAQKWKANLRYKITDHPQVEIRKTVRGSQLLILVGLHGWTHGNDTPQGVPRLKSTTEFILANPEKYSDVDPYRERATDGFNVRISMNGPASMTFQDFDELYLAVQEAVKVLESLQG